MGMRVCAIHVGRVSCPFELAHRWSQSLSLPSSWWCYTFIFIGIGIGIVINIHLGVITTTINVPPRHPVSGWFLLMCIGISGDPGPPRRWSQNPAWADRLPSRRWSHKSFG